MNYKIVYRDIDFKDELEYASKYFECVPLRSKVKQDDFIVARYACLPFYQYFEEDVKYLGGTLINTYKQHRFVANLSNWVYWFGDITPKTYYSLDELPPESEHGFVVKGETNSKKFQWNTHMFVKTKKEAIELYCDLQNDGLLRYQQLFVRDFVPLKTFFTSYNDLPITEEYRVFILNDHVIAKGYYWSSHVDELAEMNIFPNADDIPQEFLNDIIARVGRNVAFYVVDVAKTADGKWIVIELNDGQMSGLSCVHPEVLYKNLYMHLKFGY